VVSAGLGIDESPGCDFEGASVKAGCCVGGGAAWFGSAWVGSAWVWSVSVVLLVTDERKSMFRLISLPNYIGCNGICSHVVLAPIGISLVVEYNIDSREYGCVSNG
jgi:hypothetical protein